MSGYMKLMRQEISHTVEPDGEFRRDDIGDQRADAILHGIIKADEQENDKAKKKRIMETSFLLMKRQDLQCDSRKSLTSHWKKGWIETC
jgi:hypothetical protein